MSKILGLDLGSGSIGWAIIEYGFTLQDLDILDMGCRIVPIDGQTLSKFDSGQAITINADRTQKRTARKMLDRFQARKKELQAFLLSIGMAPTPDLLNLPQNELWQLRADAAKRKLEPQEIGRVLLHIAQKRGYNASKADLASSEKAKQGYVADVRNNYQQLRDSGLTIGAYYAQLIKNDSNYRIKGIVYPRQAYKDEFDRIMACQSQFYPEVLTQKNINHLRDYILFYQRPLKSCKHLVNNCELVKYKIITGDKQSIVGPQVIHKSNPIFQLNRIWQAVNNIRLTNKRDPNEIYPISLSQREQMVKHLQNHDSLKITDIYAILFNKKKVPQWAISDNVGKGIPGNKTLLKISKALGKKYESLSQLHLNIVDNIDENTGEVKSRYISNDVISQPLYRLWHTIYSVNEPERLKETLRRNFQIEDESVLEGLCAIDFSIDGYGSLSEKAIKRILPYLMEGYMYSEACEKAGYNHSSSITSEENLNRELASKLNQLKKGELRQPIVEKILNQLVNLINELTSKYGEFDEIHIELARELQMSRDERSQRTKDINKNERENKALAERIQSEFSKRPNKTRINKLKLWEESDHKCMYCEQPVHAKEFLEGYDVEVEHIIPKSLLFDDSLSNKVCACRKCNQEKGNMTAYDFMATKGPEVLKAYAERIYALADEKKISRSKRDHLLMSKDQIPQDFIDRQLRESQYISKKAMEMLKTICRQVVPTSGSVTDYIRHIWGWDRVLHDLNIDRYAKADLTEVREDIINGETRKELRIKDWSKRCDHRHHAIDALAIACTTRSVIQRLNRLNSLKDEQFKPFDAQSKAHHEKQSLLEQYVKSLPHFSYKDVCDACDRIMVSFKPGLKLVSTSKRYSHSGGKRKCLQTGISVPRGALHEETIYGKIKKYTKNGDLEEYIVVKYPLSSIKTLKDASSIVDSHIRNLVEDRLKSTSGTNDPWSTPLYSDKEKKQIVKTVRCFTGINQAVIAKRDSSGKAIGFAKPGANHHVAIYTDKNGNLVEHIASFKHCVDRHNYRLPVIINDTTALWSQVMGITKDYDQSFLDQLPPDGLKLQYSMRRNEMFILEMSADDVQKAIEDGDMKLLSQHLYRVQNLSSLYYCFVLHTQTKSDAKDFNKPDKRFIRIRSLKDLKEKNPIKVSINILGDIQKIE